MKVQDSINMSMLDTSSSPNVAYSEEWRIQEAKDIFNLLRNEYESSKKLNLLKRYKEMERIIKMFTSDPVLTKLLWLASQDLEASSSTSLETNDDEEKMENENHHDGSAIVRQRPSSTNVQDKVLDCIRNITTKLKSMAPFAMALGTSNTTNVTPDSDLSTYQCSETMPMVPSLYIKNVSSVSGLDSSPPQSCVSTPGGPLRTPSSSSNVTSFFFNVGSFFDSDTTSYSQTESTDSDTIDNNGIFFSTPTVNVCSSLGQNSVSSRDDESDNMQYKCASRRRGIETCMIRKNEIPPFQIPRQRVRTNDKPHLTIIPSLYQDSSSDQNSPYFLECNKNDAYPGLKVSMSTPNIICRNMSKIGPKIKGFINGNNREKRCCSDNCIHISSTRDSSMLLNEGRYVSGFPRHHRNGNSSISMSNVCQATLGCLSHSDLLRAYESLSHMKKEFKAMNDKTVLARYKKMKSIIKCCMEVQF